MQKHLDKNAFLSIFVLKPFAKKKKKKSIFVIANFFFVLAFSFFVSFPFLFHPLVIDSYG